MFAACRFALTPHSLAATIRPLFQLSSASNRPNRMPPRQHAWLVLFACALALVGGRALRGQDVELPSVLSASEGAASHASRDRARYPDELPSFGQKFYDPDELPAEENWPPHWTLPRPEMWEQLWRPGDLLDDSYWLRRPWSAGFLVGTMDGDSLTSQVDQGSDWLYGFRFGNDFAPHWGWELRNAFFSPELSYPRDPSLSATAHNWFVDVNVLHYPWGDTRLRPFWSIGLGAAQFKFMDQDRYNASEWVVDLPLAIGLKYHWTRWLALRGELSDTIIFGTEHLNGMNNLSFSLGAEIHWHSFKTRPVQYGY